MTQEKFNEMMNNYLTSLAKQPATWEQSALSWAQTNGLMIGNDKGEMMPKKFVTRGELVTILERLVKMLEK